MRVPINSLMLNFTPAYGSGVTLRLVTLEQRNPLVLMPLYSDLPQFEPFRQTRAVQLGPAADPPKVTGPKSGGISAAIVSLGQRLRPLHRPPQGRAAFFSVETSHNFPPSLTVKDEPISQTAVFCTGFHYHHEAPQNGIYIYIYIMLICQYKLCINNKILFVKSNNFVSERQNALPFHFFRTPVCPLCFGCAILFVNPHGRFVSQCHL